MPRAASEVVVPLMQVAVTQSTLSSWVAPDRVFGKLLKCLGGVFLARGAVSAIHVAGPVNTVDQDSFEGERGVLERAPVQSQSDKVLHSWTMVPHS